MKNSLPKAQISIVTSIQRDWTEVAHRFTEAIGQQEKVDLRAIELIVVNGTGDRQFRDYLERFLEEYRGPLRMDIFHIDKCGRAASNNFGIRHSSSDLVLLLADDFIATPLLVANHLRLHEREPDEAVVGIGPAVFPPEWNLSPFMHWLDHSGALFGVAFTGPHSRIPPPDWFYGANTSLKRSFFERAGAFDERYPYDCWDDTELGYRLRRQGMRPCFLPGAVAHHWHQLNLRDRAQQARLAGESAALTDFKYGGTEQLRKGLEHRAKTSRRNPTGREDHWKSTLARAHRDGYRAAADTMIRSTVDKKQATR